MSHLVTFGGVVLSVITKSRREFLRHNTPMLPNFLGSCHAEIMTIDSTMFRSGEALFHEGSDSTSLFLIKVGRISIRKTVDGGFVEIAQIGPNQIIGEVGFFDRRPRSADAVAITFCEAVEIPYEALKPIFDPAPDYLKKIMVGLASRLRDADEVIRELKERLGADEITIRTTSEEPADADEGESETQKILKQTE